MSFFKSETKNSDFVRHSWKKPKKCRVQFGLIKPDGTSGSGPVDVSKHKLMDLTNKNKVLFQVFCRPREVLEFYLPYKCGIVLQKFLELPQLSKTEPSKNLCYFSY